MSEPRRYTIKIDVEVRDQDDFANFQPDTVTARAVDLGMEWVSGTQSEALHDFFAFYVRLEPPPGMSLVEYGASPQLAAQNAGLAAIVRRALEEGSHDDR